MRFKINKIGLYLLIFLTTSSLCLLVVAWVVGGMLYSPARHSLDKPNIPFLYQDVVLISHAGIRIHGWMYHVDSESPAVALFHGARSNRKSMLSRAELLIRAGYNVLLIDLQAHGESQGDFISFGAVESWDVKAAISYLKNKYPDKRIGAIGTSLGGAASLLGPKPAKVDALVLEAVYPNISDAVKNRLEMKLGKLARILSPLLTMQLKLRLGVEIESLRPEKAIRKFNGALLMIAGNNDRHTPVGESRRLYSNANHPKYFWVIKDAAHVDFKKHSETQYRLRVLAFFNRHLKNK